MATVAPDAIDADAGNPEPSVDEVLLAFLERYLADRQAGLPGRLADYLAIWPEHQEAVAREYLSVLQSAAGPSSAEGAKGRLELGDPSSFGSYRIEREIGRGGQGAVYLAEDTRLHRKVALKIILRLGTGAQSRLRRFRREAEIASRLDHPGICGVHDAGIEEGLPYIAMPYLEGETLAARIKRQRSEAAARSESPSGSSTRSSGRPAGPDRNDLQEVLDVFERAAHALHLAHQAGILHRDIKPGNIMITPRNGPVIFDFGLAGLEDTEEGATCLTQSGDVVGTPAYMSPEQISGGRLRLDRRSDIYSLGVTLYECVTLSQPFEATTREALFQSILSQDPTDPRKLNRHVSDDLCVVLETALEKDRDRRYQTAESLAADLRAVREGRPIVAKKIGPIGRFARWSRREPAKAALLVAMLVSLPTIAALVTARMKDRPHVEAAQRARLEDQKDALLVEASYELTEGDPRAAVGLYEEVLRRHGPTAEAAGGLVLARLRLKDPTAALRLLDDHRAVLGGSAAAMHLRVDALRALGHEPEAAELQKGTPPPASALDHQILATQAFRDCKSTPASAFREALLHATAAILLSPHPRLQLYELRLHAAGHLQERDAIFATAAAMRRHWGRSYLAMFRCGWALKMLEDPALFDEATACIRASIELKPDYAPAHTILGNILSKRGAFEDAFVAYGKAIALNPKRLEVYMNLAIGLELAGQYERALDACRDGLAQGAPDADLLVVQGNCFLELKRDDEALAAYREAARHGPSAGHAKAMGENLARILSRRGDALSAQDRLDDAIAAYRESLQWDPRSAATHTNLGNALARQERTGEALAELEEALRIDAGFGETHSSLAWIYARVGRGDEALAEARKAVELAPRLAVAHAILGRALILKGLHEEAVAPCRAAIALDAGCQPAHHDLGLALANTGCLDEAIEAFHVSIRLEPRELAGVCNLAHALQDAGRPREALDAFSRAQQLLTAAHDPAPPLAEWIAEAKTLVQREERYEARIAEHVAAGTDPRGTRQLLELARTALGKGHADVAARWYRKAFAEEEGLLERAEGGQRRHAALAALAAAASRTDGKSLPDSERAAWRSTALTWLRAEVQQVGERSRAGELAPAGARAALVPLLRDAGLAPVRTPQPLAELPEPEREGWQRLWNEVNALVPAYPGAAKN